MSRLKIIGLGLFGRNWKIALASHLINEKGEPLRRTRIESWDKADILPDWVVEQVKIMILEREAEFEEAKELIASLKE
ncbi:hypothetical protein [Acinetobacter sp. ANC 3813]|uniref:hypothetical protein n=1 Tax=Acinetobacter sp. ANC 3813 TaxID=1977873 RepID=UPI000A32E839|nr:hypothetical protein [Acinetobacter sp. ANC 3813]OTG87918.1 hypothetical protein B9T34_16425 [Acinetobacter sp. ANC 3813]